MEGYERVFEELVAVVRELPSTARDAAGLWRCGERLNLLVWLCVAAPEPMRRLHPDLWEQGRDWVAGIRAGEIGEPWWWGFVTATHSDRADGGGYP